MEFRGADARQRLKTSCFSTLLSNISKINLKYHIMFSLTGMRILSYFFSLLVVTLLCETFGIVGLLCLIWFEKYGMDPLKRNVTNQLTSSICITGILTLIFIGPGSLYRLLVGPLPTFIGIWQMCGSIMSGLFTLFTLTQQSVLKCLYISYFSRLAPISDFFIAMFLNIFNLFFVSLVVLMFYISGIIEVDPVTNFLIGSPAPMTSSFYLVAVFM